MGKKTLSGALFFFLITLTRLGLAEASSVVVHSQEPVHIEFFGYQGLKETTLFVGDLSANAKQEIETDYKGLALLVLGGKQHYPIIIKGNQPFLVRITAPDTLPAFTGSRENTYFYALLTGSETTGKQYGFPLLMIKAKQLLDATGSIRTVDELQEMKERFHDFMRTHYRDLQHSDMLRRLIAQYFMMHEYVDYHQQGAPAADIRIRHQEALFEGVRNWLDILKPHIPQHEILNYCVSLYYRRSMVTLAHKIAEHFKEVAFCSGEEIKTVSLSPSLTLKNSGGDSLKLKDVHGNKTLSFVSDDCPVSMVETIIKARRAKQSGTTIIVVPLQPLLEKHMAMSRMISDGNLLFVHDQEWRAQYVPDELKLPLFISID